MDINLLGGEPADLDLNGGNLAGDLIIGEIDPEYGGVSDGGTVTSTGSVTIGTIHDPTTWVVFEAVDEGGSITVDELDGVLEILNAIATETWKSLTSRPTATLRLPAT